MVLTHSIPPHHTTSMVLEQSETSSLVSLFSFFFLVWSLAIFTKCDEHRHCDGYGGLRELEGSFSLDDGEENMALRGGAARSVPRGARKLGHGVELCRDE